MINTIFHTSFFKRRYSIFLEFLPQVVFLCLLFLYMVFMMFYKWVAYSTFSEGMLSNKEKNKFIFP